MDLLVLLAEGARFENRYALETIGSDLIVSVHTQSRTAEVEDELVKPDRSG